MAIIQNPTISRKLQRLLRLTALPDSILAPETVSVIIVEDASAPLSDIERGCMGTQRRPAIAAENSLVLLVRVGAPASYDLLVTEAWISTNMDQIVRLAVPTVAVLGLAISAHTSFTDFEIPGRPASQLASDTQPTIPVNRILGEYDIQADTVLRIPLDLRIGTIGRGSDLTALMWAGVTQNTEIIAGFKWTEALPQG